MTQPVQRIDTPAAKRTFTARAVMVGLLLAVFHAWFAPVARYVFFTADFVSGVLPPGVVFLTIATVVMNRALDRLRIATPLESGELIVVVSMVWLSSSAFQIGMDGNLIGVMSGVAYFSSPENRWADYYLAHLPAWVVPSNANGGVRYFYNGLPLNYQAPWGIWVVPLIWWGSLVAATLGMAISLMAIVHEQWHDHEKLTFPMAEIPLALTRDPKGPALFGGVRANWLRSRLFWYGAAIPLSFMVWNIIHFYFPGWPMIGFSQVETTLPFRYVPKLYTKVDWYTIGLAYYAPTQVLLGLWLGRLLIAGEIGVVNRFGIGTSNGGYLPWSDWGSGLIAWQCLGSLIMLVLWGAWMGREHFGRVFGAAFGRGKTLDARLRDRYRVAVWGLFASLLYMAFWFRGAGMTWPVIGAFIPILVILTVGMSKIVVESSLLFIDSPVNAQSFVLQSLGTAHIPQVSMAALVMSYAVFRSNHGLMMPQVAFASRMGDDRSIPRGKLYGAIGAAVLLAIIIAVATTIYLGYDNGAVNFQSHPFRKGHIEAYDALSTAADRAYGPDWNRLGFLGGGMALMAMVLTIRTRLVGFWLHPVGLVFASTSVASLQLINFFIAWAAKKTLGGIGGNRLVERAKPFFLGLVAGHAVGLALGILVDVFFFPGSGHDIPTGW